MKILDCPQGSPQWWEARLGIPTGSEFHRFTSPNGSLATARAKDDDGLSVGATTYAAEIIAEAITGYPKDDGFKGSPDIERGHELESMARNYLAFEIGEDIDEVGFCLSDCGRYGASPDGLTKSGIPVELKCPAFHTQTRYLITGGKVPKEYLAQVHGHMVVTGAPHAWFCAYTVSPKLRNILVEVEWDSYTENLKDAVGEFCDRLEVLKYLAMEPKPAADPKPEAAPEPEPEKITPGN